MICEDFVRFLLIVRKRKITKRRNRNGVIVLSLFFYVTGPYEEVPYRRLRSAFPTFFWRLRKRGRLHLDFTFGFLRNWALGIRYLSVCANINISIETIRANGRKNNKHDGKKRATASGSDPLADILAGYHRINEH